MLNPFIDAVKNLQLQQKIQYGIIAVLLLIVFILSLVNNNLSQNRVFRISVPPELKFGTIINTDEVNANEVYNFAGTMIQQLYFWQKNGYVDFKTNINNYRNYLTPEYREYLFAEYDVLKNLGQLANRERSLVPLDLFNVADVVAINNGWQVTIDYRLEDHINNERFKKTNIRYLIKVVIRDINPSINPWGWQLDVPNKKPVRIRQ